MYIIWAGCEENLFLSCCPKPMERKHWGIFPCCFCFFSLWPQWKWKTENATKRIEMKSFDKHLLWAAVAAGACFWQIDFACNNNNNNSNSSNSSQNDFQVLYSYWFQTKLEMQMTDLFFMLSFCRCQSTCRRCWLMSSRVGRSESTPGRERLLALRAFQIFLTATNMDISASFQGTLVQKDFNSRK